MYLKNIFYTLTITVLCFHFNEATTIVKNMETIEADRGHAMYLCSKENFEKSEASKTCEWIDGRFSEPNICTIHTRCNIQPTLENKISCNSFLIHTLKNNNGELVRD
ncbi:hypothetical protein LbFV_ORF82 [Leptopilina boulardi filamentous virus]|uniref:Uncharacterized protein n=1 Tax=Leptopilina boulardi filamentous virus TaxID=552509 RepID=A0A1S5YD41_9VIRU|nr:hypothetical protein LbFV_ORF82 [Leptopilina boulardi filamentous virus]AQQ80002.1 hypothetical protein LbFV_ORF82 [Leptopilina boulardi filamentous virus]